ncbi:MAG: hypothetical protein CM15mV96_130 [uncultured marine virus]|nr:MAG: hypothetical protein CM15mV96_130 [uncultured marine virus]
MYKQLKDVNPRMAKSALDAKDIIERLGQQLVEANIIPASSFEINKRSYLPRLYIEHVLKILLAMLEVMLRKKRRCFRFINSN